jgi:hypothetical protein
MNARPRTRSPKLAGAGDDLVQLGLGVAAAVGEGARQVFPIGGVQAIHLAGGCDILGSRPSKLWLADAIGQGILSAKSICRTFSDRTTGRHPKSLLTRSARMKTELCAMGPSF